MVKNSLNFYYNSLGLIDYNECLGGPECIEIIPGFNDTVTLRDGDDFGPLTCKADCSPPCKYQWRKILWNGDINDVINASTLPRQTVHAKGVSGYRCVVTGFHGNFAEETEVSREINLNILCMFCYLVNIITAIFRTSENNN